MPGRPRLPEIRSERVELLDPGNVLANFQNRHARDRRFAVLNEAAQRRGGRLDDRPERVLGYRHSFDAARPIRRAPNEPAADPVDRAEFEIQVQEYPTQTQDSLAVGVATITAGNNSASYPLLLEAPAGNFIAANEFTVVQDRVEPTNSWWTAVTGCLTRQCVTVCANSLGTCSGSSGWLAYLGCVAWNCGGCWVKCAGCATCNCGWWCKWAVGCCAQ
jgi:hypothetical protein